MADDKVQVFPLKPGDTLSLEYNITLENEVIPAGTFTLEASNECTVVYNPIPHERLKLVQKNTLSFYWEQLVKLSEKNNGELTTKIIDDYFKKMVFVNKLHTGDN
jgi:hypothetical protein